MSREDDYQELLEGYCCIAGERTSYEVAFRQAERLLEQAEAELAEAELATAKSRLREVTELRDQDNENWRRDTRTLAEAEAERDGARNMEAYWRMKHEELKAQPAAYEAFAEAVGAGDDETDTAENAERIRENYDDAYDALRAELERLKS
jgi:hypothetical protein